MKLLTFLIACAASAATTAPLTVTVTPTNVTFAYQLGAVFPAAQTVSVKASAGTPAYTTAITGANWFWLTVGSDSGKLPGTLSLRVNPTTLAVGVYAATVTVTVVGVTAPLIIPVTLNVTSPPSTLTVSPALLTFVTPPNPPLAQNILMATNGSPVSFSVAVGASPWLTVSPTVGVVLPGQQLALSVTVDASSLAPQSAPYPAKITITAASSGTAAKTTTVTVSLTVSSVQPVISSIWPAMVPVNAGAQTITIRGTGFYSATVAKMQGSAIPLPTTILSPSALLTVIPAAALTTSVILNVIVANPAPGGDSLPAQLFVGNVPAIQSVGNVASYGATAISPGELITIFGANIGPGIPASMSVTNGYVDTVIGGIAVSIDGQLAPILYASANQVTVQVPYEVTGGINKLLSLVNGANPPAVASMTIADSAPGLFTADGSGVGQAAALNFSATTGYTLNTSANPVKLGDIIILYMTGEGDYNQSLVPRTGLIVPATLNPLPQLNPLPTVTIGGAPAIVNYAGPLFGSILGLVQINAVVPATAITGLAVPVSVTIGANSTQGNVTLSVHQ